MMHLCLILLSFLALAFCNECDFPINEDGDMCKINGASAITDVDQFVLDYLSGVNNAILDVRVSTDSNYHLKVDGLPSGAAVFWKSGSGVIAIGPDGEGCDDDCDDCECPTLDCDDCVDEPSGSNSLTPALFSLIALLSFAIGTDRKALMVVFVIGTLVTLPTVQMAEQQTTTITFWIPASVNANTFSLRTYHQTISSQSFSIMTTDSSNGNTFNYIHSTAACMNSVQHTNPCATRVCPANAFCVSLGANTRCDCDSGFEEIRDANAQLLSCFTCTCGVFASCNNQNVCICDTGYIGNPVTGCALPAACAPVCPSNSFCSNAANNQCTCQVGYIPTGPFLADSNGVCTAPPQCTGCPANSFCSNAANNQCTCQGGYTPTTPFLATTNGVCTLVVTQCTGCPANSFCSNAASNQCTCQVGYTPTVPFLATSNGVCTFVVATCSPTCPLNSFCTNAGTNTCTCASGYTPTVPFVSSSNGVCTLIPNTCSPSCPLNSFCTNAGTNTCTCASGYSPTVPFVSSSNGVCTFIVAACSPVCPANSQCTTAATNSCTCLTGFIPTAPFVSSVTTVCTQPSGTCTNTCPGGSVCDPVDDTCTCNAGFTPLTAQPSLTAACSCTVGVDACGTGFTCVVSNLIGYCVGDGPLRFTALWSRVGDGDLHVRTPGGIILYDDGCPDPTDCARNPGSPSFGVLDVYIHSRGPENIYWAAGANAAPQTGEYTFCLNTFEFDPTPSIADPLDVTIFVRNVGVSNNDRLYEFRRTLIAPSFENGECVLGLVSYFGTVYYPWTEGCGNVDENLFNECTADQDCVNSDCITKFADRLQMYILWSRDGDGDFYITTPDGKNLSFFNPGAPGDEFDGFYENDQLTGQGPEAVYFEFSEPVGQYDLCFFRNTFSSSVAAPISVAEPVAVEAYVTLPSGVVLYSATFFTSPGTTGQPGTCDPTGEEWIYSFDITA